MFARRITAAVVTFAFAMLLCAPAFAAVWSLAAGPTKSCCCCAKKKQAPRRATVSAPACDCAACSCTVDEAPPALPVDAMPVPSASPVVALLDAPVLPLPPIARVAGPAGAFLARGPPVEPSAPLYLLYESFLI